MADRVDGREPTYTDVALLVMEMRRSYGRSTTYRLDPDFYKAGGVDVIRYWVVAECWVTSKGDANTRRAGWWFRGTTGAYTMASAMYYSLMAVCHLLDAESEAAAAQASF